VFDGPTAEASPSPSVIVSTPTPEPTPEPSVDGSTTPSPAGPTPVPTPTPPPPADGFLARAEACDEPPSGTTCDNSGAENDGTVWILVSFRHAQPTDTIAIAIYSESGALVAQGGSISLSFCGSNTDCAGWTFDDFAGLAEGEYEARATHNGTQVATTAFTVN
jgi:hypothetical protein